jgi:hypothetical protein
MFKSRLEIIICVLLAGLCLGAMAAGALHDADMWARSETQSAIELRELREKQEAYITTFEGLRVYAYDDGRVVVE